MPPSLLRRLDIAELNNDVDAFRDIDREGGAALGTAIKRSDFSFRNFAQWKQSAVGKPRWFGVMGKFGFEVVQTFGQVHDRIKEDNSVVFREFNSKKDAQEYVAAARPATPYTTYFVAIFEKEAPRLCATFALAQQASSDGALDFKRFDSLAETTEFMRAGKQWWAVIAGSRTGALDEEGTIAALSGYARPDLRGPFFSERAAKKVYDHYSRYGKDVAKSGVDAVPPIPAAPSPRIVRGAPVVSSSASISGARDSRTTIVRAPETRPAEQPMAATAARRTPTLADVPSLVESPTDGEWSRRSGKVKR